MGLINNSTRSQVQSGGTPLGCKKKDLYLSLHWDWPTNYAFERLKQSRIDLARNFKRSSAKTALQGACIFNSILDTMAKGFIGKMTPTIVRIKVTLVVNDEQGSRSANNIHILRQVWRVVPEVIKKLAADFYISWLLIPSGQILD